MIFVCFDSDVYFNSRAVPYTAHITSILCNLIGENQMAPFVGKWNSGGKLECLSQ
jgi:hypothetical protein